MTRGNTRKYLRYFILWFLGGLAGVGLSLFLFGQKLEDQMLLNRNLRLINERYVEEIRNLKQIQKVEKSRRDVIIEDVRVTVLEPKPNAFVETEVIRRMEKDFAQMKGKKADQVAEVHPVFHELMHKKEYVVDGKVVEVRLKTLLISRALHLFVVVQVKTEAIG